MFCFLRCVLMLEFVWRGLGGDAVWEGVLCSTTLSCVTHPPWKEHPSQSREWHWCHRGRWTPEHTNVIWWVLHVRCPLKQPVHSQGNNRDAALRGGCSWGREEDVLWMPSFGFQIRAGYQASPLCTNEGFKPGDHLKQLDLVLFHLKCDIIAVRFFTCDYLVMCLSWTFCPR